MDGTDYSRYFTAIHTAHNPLLPETTAPRPALQCNIKLGRKSGVAPTTPYHQLLLLLLLYRCSQQQRLTNREDSNSTFFRERSDRVLLPYDVSCRTPSIPTPTVEPQGRSGQDCVPVSGYSNLSDSIWAMQLKTQGRLLSAPESCKHPWFLIGLSHTDSASRRAGSITHQE